MKRACCFKSRYGVLTLDQSLDCARSNVLISDIVK